MLEKYNLSGLHVLVVDDNRNMRVIVKNVLRILGIRLIREAEDGAEAIKVLKTFAADIVITDWVMSPIDGLELTHMIRHNSDSRDPYVPVIMLTGHTEMSRVSEARDVGITEYLAKPISAHSLYARIVSAIEHPRPFIRTKTFFGPDRRRRVDKRYNGPERRVSDL